MSIFAKGSLPKWSQNMSVKAAFLSPMSWHVSLAPPFPTLISYRPCMLAQPKTASHYYRTSLALQG